jgi:hypothetical protein
VVSAVLVAKENLNHQAVLLGGSYPEPLRAVTKVERQYQGVPLGSWQNFDNMFIRGKKGQFRGESCIGEEQVKAPLTLQAAETWQRVKVQVELDISAVVHPDNPEQFGGDSVATETAAEQQYDGDQFPHEFFNAKCIPSLFTQKGVFAKIVWLTTYDN